MLRTALSALQHSAVISSTWNGEATALGQSVHSKREMSGGSVVQPHFQKPSHVATNPMRSKNDFNPLTASTVYDGSYLAAPFSSVAVDATGQYIAATSFDGMFVSTNSGSTYTIASTDLGYDVGIAANNPQYMVFCAGYELFTSTDYGTTFQPSNITGDMPNGNSFIAVTITGNGQYAYAIDNYIYTGFSPNYIYASADFLNSFHPLTGSHYLRYNDITTSTDGNYVYAITNSTMYTSTDHGTTWTESVTPSLSSAFIFTHVATNGNGQYITLSTNGNVYLSNNYGKSWRLYLNSYSFTAMSSSGQYIYVATGEEVMYSSNYGASATQTLAPPVTYQGIATTLSGNMTVAVAQSIYINTNPVASWYPNNYNWVDVAMSQNGETIFALAGGDTAGFGSMTTNGGLTWLQTGYTGSYNSFYYDVACDAICQHIAVSVPVYYELYISSNYGKTWKSVQVESYSEWQNGCVGINADGQYMTSVFGQMLYYSSDYGSTWMMANASMNQNWKSIAISSSGALQYAASFGGLIYTSFNYGVDWYVAGNIVSGYWYSVSSDYLGVNVLACQNNGQTGAVYYSNDNGLNWAKASLPDSVLFMAAAVSANGEYMYVASSEENAGVIYISTNDGSSWTLLANAPKLSYKSITCSLTGQNVTAVATSGPVIVSTNYGATWVRQNIQFSLTNDFGTLNNDDDDDDNSTVLSDGAIAGIVIGVIAFCLCFVALVGYFFFGLCQKKSILNESILRNTEMEGNNTL